MSAGQVYSLYIINKSGGLVFQSDYGREAPKLDLNDHMRLGSTFHGLHAIASTLSPNGSSSGIQVIEGDTFRLHCLQTSTGTKFFLTADKNRSNLDALLKAVYEIYSDYVLKNPFYELEQPIRCELFDMQLERLLIR
eukprot:TRINITY_DN13147_c0_g1_i1.p1 TRINITY_DN13147_c0_g1~~TRINITY_DN13147_c0_g1_i1.p1  ORF type:complete len:137 (+),score=31.67 TRINITY_DN13147_c0_g1_i1:2-412(+)